MPKLSTSRRHRRSQDLTCIHASPPALEKKTPRFVSEEDVRRSQNCSDHGCSGNINCVSVARIPQFECMDDIEITGDNAVVSSASSSSFSSMSSNTTQQCQEEGERSRRGLKRRKPSGCLVALGVGETTPSTPKRNDIARVTVTPTLQDSSPPWGHYVDTILPHEDDGDNTWSTGATFPYPTSEVRRLTQSQSQGLEMHQRRSFVPSCPMPHPTSSVAKHAPYPLQNIQQTSAMFRQRKRHRIKTPHMLALDENPEVCFQDFVLTLPVPASTTEIKMVEEAQRAMKELNVD